MKCEDIDAAFYAEKASVARELVEQWNQTVPEGSKVRSANNNALYRTRSAATVLIAVATVLIEGVEGFIPLAQLQVEDPERGWVPFVEQQAVIDEQ